MRVQSQERSVQTVACGYVQEEKQALTIEKRHAFTQCRAFLDIHAPSATLILLPCRGFLVVAFTTCYVADTTAGHDFIKTNDDVGQTFL
jgi:hypothetical protein